MKTTTIQQVFKQSGEQQINSEQDKLQLYASVLVEMEFQGRINNLADTFGNEESQDEFGGLVYDAVRRTVEMCCLHLDATDTFVDEFTDLYNEMETIQC